MGHICQGLSCLMRDIHFISIFINEQEEWGKKETKRFKTGWNPEVSILIVSSNFPKQE